MRPAFVACTAFAISQVIALPATAQWKPDKAIEIIAPSGPAGTTDRTARVVARILQKYKMVDVPVTVVNKPGGSGAIGYTYLNQHAGDGHYIIIGTSGSISNYITGTVPFNYTDFTSVAMLFDEWMSVNTQVGSPMKTARDLVDRLKQNPDAFAFGISTSRSGGNFTTLMTCLRAAGIDIKRVKTVIFQGGGATTQALLGGHVEAINTGPGKLRTLAISGPKRLWGPFAAVPTWREQGVPADAGSWRAVQGPKGMSAAQLAYWDSLFRKLVQTEDWKKDLEENFWINAYAAAPEAKRVFDREYEEYKAILTELGMSKL